MSDEPKSSQPFRDLAPLNRIRVETALSRFPIHRIARKGLVSIDLQRLTEGGEADFKWKVSYNTEFGQPGPLAYKVDTVVVNRRIDEVGRPLPEVIRLGSLSEICRALGSADTGPNIADLKRAFLQNASAFINAKIRYKTKTGRERWAEIGYSRYSVVFTGDSLPDGRLADAVYIILNPPYRDLLNHVEVRPLDYDYLLQLSPGPQRLYELLSFQMYGALAGGRPRAKLLYSEYCLYAPLTRYLEFDQVKKQMYKVHLPHRDSGYIAKVAFEECQDREGKPDWEMFYTPGPKAFAEFQAFTRRAGALLPAIPTANPKSSQTPPQQQSLELGLKPSVDETLLAELTGRGISAKRARALLADLKTGQEVVDQLEWIDSVVAQAPPGKFHNPPGLYITTVQDNVKPPESFWSSRRQRLWQEAQEAKDLENARQLALEIAYEEHQRECVHRYIQEELPNERYTALHAQALKELRSKYRHMAEEHLNELASTYVRAELMRDRKVKLPTFEEFRRSQGLAS